MDDLDSPVALITGASRGIGAATARRLAESGVDVVINYRDKSARAERVADEVRSLGRRALTVQADLTDPRAAADVIDSTIAAFGRLDLLILNASGGLEKDMPADYAMQLNRDAQINLAETAVRQMRGGRIVFVTSHEAHFYDADQETLPHYAPVAASKNAGERALRDRAESFADREVSLVVVSGDLIDGTITARLLDRARPGLVDDRRQQAGYLPTVEDFAGVVADAALDPDADKIIFVGELPGH